MKPGRSLIKKSGRVREIQTNNTTQNNSNNNINNSEYVGKHQQYRYYLLTDMLILCYAKGGKLDLYAKVMINDLKIVVISDTEGILKFTFSNLQDLSCRSWI